MCSPSNHVYTCGGQRFPDAGPALGCKVPNNVVVAPARVQTVCCISPQMLAVCLELAPPAYREVVFLVDHISKTRVHACTARRTGSKSAAAAAASCQQACLPACQMEAIPSNSSSYRDSRAAQHLHEKQHVKRPSAVLHVRSGAVRR